MTTQSVETTSFDAGHLQTGEMKKFFADNGYVIVENVFSPAELTPVKTRLEEIIADPSRAPQGVGVGRENEKLNQEVSLEID